MLRRCEVLFVVVGLTATTLCGNEPTSTVPQVATSPPCILDPWYSNPDSELRAHGRWRAEVDYQAGRAQIEKFGLLFKRGDFDAESGFYVRERGCCIMNGADIESDAYNARLMELVNERGYPENATGLRERYQYIRSFIDEPHGLDWHELPLAAPGNTESASVGPYDVYLNMEGYEQAAWLVQKMIAGGDVPLPEVTTMLNVECAGELVMRHRVFDPEGEWSVAYWPEADLIVVRKHGRFDHDYFIDPIGRRIMLEHLHGLEALIGELKPAVARSQ